jgi:hypothetical protein
LPRHLVPELLGAFHLRRDLGTALGWYTAGYAAFRAGVATLCGTSHRQCAVQYYKHKLRAALGATQGGSL